MEEKNLIKLECIKHMKAIGIKPFHQNGVIVDPIQEFEFNDTIYVTDTKTKVMTKLSKQEEVFVKSIETKLDSNDATFKIYHCIQCYRNNLKLMCFLFIDTKYPRPNDFYTLLHSQENIVIGLSVDSKITTFSPVVFKEINTFFSNV